MADNVLNYKGYQAIILFSTDDLCLYGVVQDIDDKIVFEIDNPQKANEIFAQVIDDYLALCEEVGKCPCKAFKGIFNVRVSPDIHKKAVQHSRKIGITLNEYVSQAIEAKVNGKYEPKQINVFIQSGQNAKTHDTNWDDNTRLSEKQIYRNKGMLQ